jgi:hypothetical protein
MRRGKRPLALQLVEEAAHQHRQLGQGVRHGRRCRRGADHLVLVVAPTDHDLDAVAPEPRELALRARDHRLRHVHRQRHLDGGAGRRVHEIVDE